MADVVRDLVVSLSLDAGEFTRNMRAINASIKEAESSFRLAGAGVGLETRKRILGHTVDATARRYDHDEHLAEVKAAMEAAAK